MDSLLEFVSILFPDESTRIDRDQLISCIASIAFGGRSYRRHVRTRVSLAIVLFQFPRFFSEYLMSFIAPVLALRSRSAVSLNIIFVLQRI